MIGNLVINVYQEALIWRLNKHSTIRMNWLMQLNDGTLHIQLNTESNDRTQYLFSYNTCKHMNASSIYMRDIIKGWIHLR